jgi:hypothetical protein
MTDGPKSRNQLRSGKIGQIINIIYLMIGKEKVIPIITTNLISFRLRTVLIKTPIKTI